MKAFEAVAAVARTLMYLAVAVMAVAVTLLCHDLHRLLMEN